MDTKEIRKALKSKLGYNARQVSIRKRHYSSIVFTIRSVDVDYNKLKEFAESYESIDRCDRTQEILAGGNTFVTVQIDDSVCEEVIERYRKPLSCLVDDMSTCERDGQGKSSEAFTKRIVVFRDTEWIWTLYIDGTRENTFHPSNAIRAISVELWTQGITIKK